VTGTKERAASSASHANQAGEPTASPAGAAAAVPCSSPSATEGICVIPCPTPLAPDVPNVPNSLPMVEGCGGP
jgi:hypothetical protein